MKNFFVMGFLITMPLLVSAEDSKRNSCCPGKQTCNPVNKLATQENENKTIKNDDTTKEIIQQAYGAVASEEPKGFVCDSGGCCGGGNDLSLQIGYDKQELKTFAGANLGLGCGNPVSLGHIKKGDTVLDLGSGAGLDCFLASEIVGSSGKVIGIDMTQEMIERARKNSKEYGITNVEFRRGDIEVLPVDSSSVDVVMSNCVINLATNKKQVFNEAHRVLKQGGKMVVSDVVLCGQLTQVQKNDSNLLCACVSGAMMKDEYIEMLEQVGFDVTVIDEDKEINKKWFGSDELPISSLKFVAYKK